MAKGNRFGDLPVLDGHNDSIILRRVRGDAMDFAVADATYHVDLPRMIEGGQQGVFVMCGGGDLRESLILMDAIYQMEANHPEDFTVCRTARDVRAAFREDRVALVISIESQTMFDGELAYLRDWARLGVRVATLTHGESADKRKNPNGLQVDGSYFGFETADERERRLRDTKGLTPLGREALKAMAECGIALDLAHANDRAFWECLDLFDGPICYTHGSCFALSQHARNMTDEQMKAFARKGGVLGICFHEDFVDPANPTIERIGDHFMHALDIMGPDHVGVGSDFDGCAWGKMSIIRDVSELPLLWKELRRRGVPSRDLVKIAYKNFLRMLP